MKCLAAFLPFVVLAVVVSFIQATCAGESPSVSDPAQPVDFARDVRPILAEHCYRCHGPDMQESNYRLDVRRIALGTADFGEPPIVLGNSVTSPLIHYVADTDEGGVMMPPADEGKRLSLRQVAVLRAWVDQGAKWPDAFAGVEDTKLTTDHWSFQPVGHFEPPPHESHWVRNGIDAFILRRLREQGIEPSDDADRVTLIRRVFLDMHGLPPTPQQVKEYLEDDLADAYARLVERVLNSPHYGERWARHWLDIVRFGESHGFETNPERPNAYHYRDYVIQSLNDDKPYNRFIVEQLAGDAVGVDAGTGFLVGGPYDQVKSPDVNLTMMQRQDELADIVNTAGTAFLGLTVGCARCHNHKFDPILQKDYYSLQAVFAGVQHGERPMRTPDNDQLYARMAAAQQRFDASRQELAELRLRAPPPSAVATKGLRPPVEARLNFEEFPPIEARWVRFTIRATNSGAEPCLDEIEVFAKPANENSQALNVALASLGATATASGTLPGFDIHKLAHINDGRHGNSHSWISDSPGRGWVQIGLAAPTRIHHITWGRDREGRFTDRLATDYTIEVAREPDQWHEVASSSDRKPRTGKQESPDAFIDRLRPDLAKQARQARSSADRWERELRKLKSAVPVAYIGTFSEPDKTYRLYRGDPMAPREEVAPDALTVTGTLGLSTTTPEQQRRLALARWIADADNPLTARVIVNRVWQYHFGTGIISTPSDLGANGTTPSHPELLDWLAEQFVDNGWSLKQLHRSILLSSAYRQSSRPRASALAKDAGSRLLWRFPPRRLEAEAIRDCILQVTGCLNPQAGGPGFKVFDVKKETVHHYFPKQKFGPPQWRRMIYMTKIRQEQDAVFGAFDCPDGGQVIPNRSRSTTPLQALNLLNSHFMIEQAELLAERLRQDAAADRRAQVRRAFQLLFSRDPGKDELQESITLVQKYGLDALCRALLNSSEFLFFS